MLQRSYMRLFHKSLSVFFLIVLSGMFFSNCAVIIPPDGGPRDSLPPNLVSASPADSSLNFTGKKIELVFDEYITVQNVQQNLIVSPVVKSVPTVSSYLNKITVNLKEPLEPNTTYSFDFGTSIKDANEGNPYKNYTYVISTGNHLDTDSIAGTITLAETGKVDSTLLAVLYTDFSDTAIYKSQPRYYTRVDTTGRFVFRFLPKGQEYNLFAVANTYMRNYSDTTQLFGFYDRKVTAGQPDSIPVHLYAYHQSKTVKRPARVISERQRQQQREKDAKQPLNVSLSVKNTPQSLIDPLHINYSKPLKTFDPGGITLRDTNYVEEQNYTINKSILDSNNSAFTLTHTWQEDKEYILVISKEAAVDSFDIMIAKADTSRFKIKPAREYASFTMIFPDVDLAMNPVVQLFKANTLVDSIAIPESRRVVRQLYEAGDYQLRVLYDTNKNMKWDPGNYLLRRQPELVIPHKKDITLKANWENELEIYIYR